jgi:MinD superfamily P-loop ATPase
MKRIGIYSGKGGVGKTTIAANLALILSQNGHKILAGDTDVDAPNLSILFSPSNGPANDENAITVQTTEKAEFHPEKCTRCRRCVDEHFCHFNALSWDATQNSPVIDVIACEGCKACALLCPEKTFSIHPVDSGHISTVHSPYGFDVITGETILGAQTSGKLVTEMKKYAEDVASRTDRDVIIYDGPPGIGCPVIASISGLDYVIVIMEPTAAALHDAQRLIQVVRNFKIPFGVILNKADIWSEGAATIRTYVSDNHIPLLGEIPLDAEWPISVAKRQPYVHYRPQSPVTQIFREIVTNLETQLKIFQF